MVQTPHNLSSGCAACCRFGWSPALNTTVRQPVVEYRERSDRVNGRKKEKTESMSAVHPLALRMRVQISQLASGCLVRMRCALCRRTLVRWAICAFDGVNYWTERHNKQRYKWHGLKLPFCIHLGCKLSSARTLNVVGAIWHPEARIYNNCFHTITPPPTHTHTSLLKKINPQNKTQQIQETQQI